MNHDSVILINLLKEFCLKHICSTEDFAKAEAAVLDGLFLMLADAFGKALEEFDSALASEHDKSWRVKDKRHRTILTEFGDVAFTRRIYIDECGKRRTLLDEVMALRQRKRLSPGAFEALAYLGGEIPYARAAKTLFRHCSTAVSAMTTMTTLREVGDLLETEATVSSHMLFECGVIPNAKSTSAELCIEADGVWVALQGKEKRNVEIKALSAYAGKENNQRIGCIHHAAIAPTKRFFEEGLTRVATHFRLERLKHVWAASDGGSWEKQLPEFLPFCKVTHSLDPWHLNKAIKAAWPDKKDSAVLFKLLYSKDIDGLIDVLRLRLDTGYGDAKKTGALLGYIENNYDSIVSKSPSMGTMESTIAHLYAARMKAFGGAWCIKGASDMARIRSYVFSGDDLPMPKSSQVFSAEEQKHREKAWVSIQTKQGLAAADVIESEGKGYEPPQGHMMPLSTASPSFAMFNPLIRE
jgi:hypothetical protein